MDAPLLKTKLYIPPVRPDLVPRPRLVERLNAGLQRKLALISAPAGFGKTTLLSEWVANCGRPLAWVSLDEGDNDPARFWAYFIAALETLQADVGQSTLALLRSSPSPPLEAILTTLINAAATIPGDFVLVLDDYHVIESQPIHEAIAFLLDHLPSQMHLVIASRSAPPLQLARLRARGQLVELHAADLRFTPDEAATFLNRVMGLNLAVEHIATLEARTEGWIAGLQLAALSMRGREDIPGFIAAFSGSQRYILDYLVEEVLQRQAESVQTFLLQTSLLERMTGPLCDALTDTGSGQAMLDRLERANLFVVPLDDGRHWYRYHRLFADFLRARLRQMWPDQVPDLHRRASEWYEQSGQIAEAIDHALSAGDFERTARLVEQAAEATLMRSEFATLLRWFEALPEEAMRARPILRVYRVGLQMVNGQPQEVIEAQLQEAVQADTDGSILAGATAIRAFIAAHQGDARQSVELARQALELLPEESLFLRSSVAGFLGLGYLYTGDIVAADRVLDEAIRIGRKVGNLLTVVVSLCHLAELSVLQGQLRRARAFYDQALEVGADGQGRARPIACLALMGLGQLLREWNDLGAATRHFEEGIELSRKWGEVGAVQGYVGLALVSQARGDAEGARRAIQKARQLAAEFDATEKDILLVTMCQVRLWVAQGDVGAVLRWAEERGVSRGELEKEAASASLPLYRALEYVALARLLVAQGRFEEVPELLESLLQVAEAAGWMGLVIEALALRALALRGRGKTPQALTALQRALSLAEPEGYVRIFVDEGQPMAELLSALSRQRSPADSLQIYVSKLLSAFELESSKLQLGGSPVRPSALIEPLSERELEVLRLVAAGLSNREVAERLVVAVSTVKTHVNNIYRKLDVSTRTQAVARARELNLL
jgi:LuxR family maltose regulon positive regulatory protein